MPSDMWVHELWAPYVSPLKSEDSKLEGFFPLYSCFWWRIFFFLKFQARAYARAMKATLFFSSSTHNINVNKIFKFITAKLFNLPWTVERNLTVGEPIIDFWRLYTLTLTKC